MPETYSIIDQYGRAIPKVPVTGEIAVPTEVGVRSVWHEPVATGLTPQRLARVLKESARPGGETREYLTLAEEIEEREPHYRSVLSTRKLAIRGLKPMVAAPTEEKEDVEIADQVRALVVKPAFRKMLSDLADGIAKGYSVVEVVWETRAERWEPTAFKWRDPRFFQYDRIAGQELRLRVEGNLDGDPLPPGNFIVHEPHLKSGIPIRGGIARTAMWMFMLKSFSLKDWMAFLDAYGIPWRVGKWHPGATDDEKKTLLRAVASVASDGAIAIPNSMVVELLEAKAGSNTDAFERACRYLDALVSKLVLGQTMTTDDGSSLSQAKVHEEVRLELLAADGDELAATLQRDLLEPYVWFNRGVPKNGFPTLTFPVEEPEDLEKLMSVTGHFIDRGGRVSMAEVRDKLGWGDPGPEEEILRPASGPATPLTPALAAARVPQLPTPDALVVGADALAGRAQDRMLDDIREIIASSASLSDVLAKLQSLALPRDELRGVMRQMLVLAELMGRADIAARARSDDA
jgi:phage gp29-like protein